MDTFIMNLSLRWLTAADAFSVAKVCKAWNVVLSSKENRGTQDVWKQICLNTHPATANAFLSVQPLWDFRFLTKQLQPPVVERYHSLPTLTVNEVFAVVELYRRAPVGGQDNTFRRLTLGSFASDYMENTAGGFRFQMDQTGVALEGANPFCLLTDLEEQYLPSNPFGLAFKHAAGALNDHWNDFHLRTKVTLFRRDNMKSVCILDRAFDQRYSFEPETADSLLPDYYKLDTSSTQVDRDLAFDNTKEGEMAVDVMRDRGFDNLKSDAQLHAVPLKAPPGSDEEPFWLAEMRERSIGDPLSKDARAALNEIPAFEFDISNFSLQLKVARENGSTRARGRVTANDMLVALEGLRWR